MDKNPGITCVVNKTNTIDSTYRNFQMEVLAGEDNLVAKVSCPLCYFSCPFTHDLLSFTVLHHTSGTCNKWTGCFVCFRPLKLELLTM